LIDAEDDHDEFQDVQGKLPPTISINPSSEMTPMGIKNTTLLNASDNYEKLPKSDSNKLGSGL